MDLRQLQYIVAIAEENNITRAAEKLYITQSALNQQLLKLEKELGVQLFHRSRTDWHPTEAGEIYLKAAREMLLLKKDTYHRIHDLAKIQQGELSVGFTPGRGIAMFSHVYPKFHRQHPNIQVTPRELSVQKQQELLISGELDLGFVTLVPEQQKSALSYVSLASEKILLGIPIKYLFAIHPDKTRAQLKDIPVTLYDLREEPFILTYQESTLRGITDHVFHEAGFKPHVLFETSSNATIATMVNAGICCGLIPSFYTRGYEKNVQFFPLPDNLSWNVMACFHKKRYLSKAARDFISLATEFWSDY
ncbi:LysR family transcriptional regulator [Blautia sp. MSJ-19]|uniref:LysR family transcriptional regulator n=1 Tax=Blautia sp. MSJ-19 TaxID=2841517 RepID=UPI001C0ECD63|nr:LysR family transcriptional regulator [Blautia sp. MSJ-19]MBU5480483.1 LysR family transcriptional regulator [Blautia sp. MSJ-19]